MKRKRSAHVADGPFKKPRDDAFDQSTLATTPGVSHPVLRRLYPEVFSLRHYLLSRLPPSSKNRRRKISQLGVSDPSHSATTRVDVDLSALLDSTLVGVPAKAVAAANQELPECASDFDTELVNFSQYLPDGRATGGTFKPGYFLHPETVDFVIWLLFKRCTSHKPSHLLCHGFQRAGLRGHYGTKFNAAHGIPGIASCSPNAFVTTIKGQLWCRLHSLLGPGGDRMMMDLLLNCGIFCCVDKAAGNYYQLSGIPISELKSEQAVQPLLKNIAKTYGGKSANSRALHPEARTPSAIVFVRSRMLYARAALNAKGGVRFGMRHIHVLNRYPDRENHEQTVHIMRYIFPRQFDLHNVFTSKVDSRETAMPFKDYTLREKEIQQKDSQEASMTGLDGEQITKRKSHLPKRLRGEAVALVDKLRKLNHKCSYIEMLRHYCPVEGVPLSSRPDWRKNSLQPSVDVRAGDEIDHHDNGNDISRSSSRTIGQTCFTDMACPSAHVSAFCRAIIAKVIPNDFWGDEDNKRVAMWWIDQFICLRRHESLSLRQVTQKVKVSSLAWLRPPGPKSALKMAKTDFDKRQEIFMEFVYWVFDSFLVPLVRSNFHVTESNAHRNRLFYFRHDVWRMVTEPTLSNIRLNMFEELSNDNATKLLSTRTIGFSKVRLLPKSAGVRLITNLKSRQQIKRNGTVVLGRSINSVMAPVFNVMNYEKSIQPDRFGCSLFSVGDMFPKLEAFRASLKAQALEDKPLYFAKIDVKSCFDTIPQKRLLNMVESLLSTDEYQNRKHVEMRPLGKLQRLEGQHVDPLTVKRYIPHSRAAGDDAPFDHLVREKFAANRANTIFVDMAAQQYESKDNLMHLLREHVERNLVKIGKRFYRQKTGIPQGSVLSSILCNFFYAELERDILSFCFGPESLLLRLLDDFLLITTNKKHADRFIRVMHRGNADYGVQVKREKSLANFDVETEDAYRVARCASDVRFPYCGVHIDTRTLEVRKSEDRAGRTTIVDSLTVDLSKVPGQTFHRKALNAFKIQLQAMFIDTSFNTVPTVLANLHQTLLESAVRCFEYVRTLSKARPTHSRLLIRTVDNIIALAFVMLQRRTRSKASQNAERVRTVITRRQVQWLACKAYTAVFQRRQTQHRVLLAWLETSLAAVRPNDSAESCMLHSAIAWRADSWRK